MSFFPTGKVTLPSSYSYSTTASTGTVTINSTSSIYGPYSASGSMLISNIGSSSWASTAAQANLTVTGDADFSGDVKIQGISIMETLEKINERLAILVPDPNKLEKYQALRKAYDHYKLIESLITNEDIKYGK